MNTICVLTVLFAALPFVNVVWSQTTSTSSAAAEATSDITDCNQNVPGKEDLMFESACGKFVYQA